MKLQKYFQILSFFIVLFTAAKVIGQKPYIDENISYWYSVTSEIHINHNVYFDEDSAHIYLEITFNEGTGFDDYFYITELQGSYHTLDLIKTDTLQIKDRIVALKSDKIYTYFTLPNNDKIDLAIIKVVNKRTGIDYVYDIPFIKDYNFSTDGLVFFNEDGVTPILSSFINQGQAFQLKSIPEFNGPVYGFYYSQQFEEGAPPMVTEKSNSSKTLKIDSTFMIQVNEPFSLNKTGLYFFQKDSATANGIGIRVQDPYFPLLKTFEQVLDPLIFISTRSETEAIRNDPNPKEAFEQYWINLIKVPSLATATVRDYYVGVEGANYLFTNFEEGWKSDMGLIYIIYGPPNDVYKSEEIVDWVYNRDLSMPTVRFSFYKVKNVFTDHHYTLLRKKDYDKNWFKAVELWRDGKK